MVYQIQQRCFTTQLLLQVEQQISVNLMGMDVYISVTLRSFFIGCQKADHAPVILADDVSEFFNSTRPIFLLKRKLNPPISDPCGPVSKAQWVDSQVRWSEAVSQAWYALDDRERHLAWERNVDRWKTLQANGPWE